VPAIDLAKLRQQAFDLSELLEQPGAFRDALHSLLAGHSHHLLRRGRSMAERGALPAWDVPGLLIRELEAALLPAVEKNPSAALAAAAAVWPSGRVEEKKLAAFLAGRSGNPAEIRNLLLVWLKDAEDPILLRSLAERVCPPLWIANSVLFRSDVRSWIEDPAPPRRRFGWTALGAWTNGKTSESVFAAFDLLPAVFRETDPEAIQSAARLLEKLAVGFPQDAQGWLSDLTPKLLQQGRKFLRTALPRLPEETAGILRSMQREG
jgi:hypothetical protein